MKKLNNKGFSLVELIIVIAIMVIMVAVLAPQFTKYVERSRVSTDVQTASAIAEAIEIAIAEGKDFSGATTTAKQSFLPMTAGNYFAGKVDSITVNPSLKSTKIITTATDRIFTVVVEGYNVKVYGGKDVAPAKLLYPTVGSDFATYTD